MGKRGKHSHSGTDATAMVLKEYVFLTLTALYGLPVDAAPQKSGRMKSRGLVRDRAALIALKKSVSDPGRSSVNAWKARGNPCFPKPWPHINCASGRVSTVDLSNLDIVGTLPARLKVLNRVTELNLENNRFTGDIPSGWAHRTKLRNLKTINLGNNMLTGHLPNRKWNSKNAFRSLEILDLSQNMLSGGLPDGWLSTANTFRRLKLLDLSDNQLGLNSDGSALVPYTGSPDYGWCLQGRTDDSGWCPATVSKARAASLEVLDLSENGLAGMLPHEWAQMFPNLQSLLLHRNSFYTDTDAPGALPDAWTRRTVPRAFTQLEALVLYPGNAMICSVPDLDTNSFSDINGAMSYLVEDDAGMEFDGENPWFCPGPADDNPPTQVAVTVDGTVKLAWAVPEGDGMDKLVFGYRFTLTRYNFDQEEYQIVPGWTARTIKVHGGNSEGLAGDSSGYTLDTRITPGEEDIYQLKVSTINMDGVESSAATASSPMPQCPASGDDYNCGSSLGQCSCGYGFVCVPSTSKCSDDQTQLLLAFKRAFTAESIDGTQLVNWVESDTACNWNTASVKCDSSVVTEIILQDRNLVASLPDLVKVLPATLTLLGLTGNKIKGTIPASWSTSQLRYLSLASNDLTGSIPQDFAANLPDGSLILLNDNKLTGSIPTISFSETGLYLHYNQLSGSLPAVTSGTSGNIAIKPGNPGLCGDVPADPEGEDGIFWYVNGGAEITDLNNACDTGGE